MTYLFSSSFHQFIGSSFHQFIISSLLIPHSSLLIPHSSFLNSSINTRSFRYNFAHTSQNHSMTYFSFLISSFPQFLNSSVHHFIRFHFLFFQRCEEYCLYLMLLTFFRCLLNYLSVVLSHFHLVKTYIATLFFLY